MMNPMMNPMMNMFMNPQNPQYTNTNPNPLNTPNNANNPGFANPSFFNPFMQMFNPVNNPMSTPPPSTPIVPSPQSTNLQQLYSAQLQTMKDMGFINEDANIRALQASGGDVNVAIERLLNMLG